MSKNTHSRTKKVSLAVLATAVVTIAVFFFVSPSFNSKDTDMDYAADETFVDRFAL